jgi:hypothetical protein
MASGKARPGHSGPHSASGLLSLRPPFAWLYLCDEFSSFTAAHLPVQGHVDPAYTYGCDSLPAAVTQPPSGSQERVVACSSGSDGGVTVRDLLLAERAGRDEKTETDPF